MRCITDSSGGLLGGPQRDRAAEMELHEITDATGRGKTVVSIGAPDGKSRQIISIVGSLLLNQGTFTQEADHRGPLFGEQSHPLR